MPVNNKPVGATMIFVNPAHHVLLFLRDDKKEIPYPNCWDVLGGQVEAGETPAQAIQREMREEIEVQIAPPELFRVFDLEDRTDWVFWQRLNLAVEEIPLHEGQRLRWFSAQEIADMPENKIAYGFKEILSAFFAQTDC